MNKEQQELLDEAYENYLKGGHIKWLNQMEVNTPAGKMNIPIPYTQEEFIEKCKTDSEFSQRWVLKIEERELSDDERSEIRDMQYFKNNLYQALKGSDTKIDWENIPTKLITVTYNDIKIESYE